MVFINTGRIGWCRTRSYLLYSAWRSRQRSSPWCTCDTYVVRAWTHLFLLSFAERSKECDHLGTHCSPYSKLAYTSCYRLWTHLCLSHSAYVNSWCTWLGLRLGSDRQSRDLQLQQHGHFGKWSPWTQSSQQKSTIWRLRGFLWPKIGVSFP